MSRVAATAVLAAVAVLCPLSSARADENGTATSTDNGYDATATSSDSSSPQSTGPGPVRSASTASSGPTTCTANGVTGPITSKALTDQQIEDAFTHHASYFHGHEEPGQYYEVFCGGEYLNIEWVPDGSPPPGQGGPLPAPVDPRAIAVDAEKEITLPTPGIHLNPAGDQLVNLPTWLWIDPADLQAPPLSVSAGPVTVTVNATAVRVRWDMGDGHVVTCNGPGTPWTGQSGASPDCGYTYARSSSNQPGEAYKVTATVDWSASFTVTGAPGGGPLPTLQRSASIPVRVAEAQALNTN